MPVHFSDQLRYAAAAGLLAAAWGYRQSQRAQSSEDSANDSKTIPPFRFLEAGDGRQLRAREDVKHIDCGEGSDGLKCEVAVLGSGSGGGMPALSCLMKSGPTCSVCSGSNARNVRTPESLMVRVSAPESDESFVALVDCSQAAKRQLCIARSLFGDLQLDAVMVTGGQVDKYLGLNDLREVQHASRKDFRSGSGESLGVYACRSTIEMMRCALPFLFNVKTKTKTLVAGLAAQEVSEKLGERVPVSSDVSVTVRALPGTEGQVGFVFGRDAGCVVIVPDPHVSPEAREWLAERAVRLLLIGSVSDRAELAACAELVNAVKPRHAVVTGLSCFLDHTAAAAALQADVGDLSVSVAYDGMLLETGIEDEDLSKPSLGECSCLSSGSTATGSASTGSETLADDDRCSGFSPTHGPVEGGGLAEDRGAGCRLEDQGPIAPLTPVALSALDERHSRSV